MKLPAVSLAVTCSACRKPRHVKLLMAWQQQSRARPAGQEVDRAAAEVGAAVRRGSVLLDRAASSTG